MPLWFALSLLSALAWGIGQIVVKSALLRVHSSVAYFIVSIVSIAIVVPLVLLSGALNLSLLPLVLVLSLVACLGRICYYRAAEEGPMSLVGTVVASYPMFTVILAAAFLGEVTTAIQKLCIGLIVGGAVLMSWTTRGSRGQSAPVLSWLPLALATAFAFGAGGFLAKWGVVEAGGLTFLLAASLNQVWISGGWLFRTGRARGLRWIDRGVLLVMVSGILFTVAHMSIFVALETGPSSLIFPISSGCTLVTLVLAFLLLRERLAPVQWLGAVMASVGIIWIGWT